MDLQKHKLKLEQNYKLLMDRIVPANSTTRAYTIGKYGVSLTVNS